MTAKEFLNHARKLNVEVKQLQDARKEAFAIACGSGLDYSSEKVQSSSGNSSERRFIACSDYSLMLDEKIAELEAYREWVIKIIYKLDDTTYRTLLLARYINCKTWEKIAADMNFDLRWVHRLHGRAIQAIESHYQTMISCKL